MKNLLKVIREIKEIIIKFPKINFTPIGRWKYFLGINVIFVIDLLFQLLFGEVTGLLLLIAGMFNFFAYSYLLSAWMAKRFIDIHHKVTNPRKLQKVLFVLVFIASFITTLIGAEAEEALLSGQISQSTIYLLIIGAIILIPSVLFNLYLLFSLGQDQAYLYKEHKLKGDEFTKADSNKREIKKISSSAAKAFKKGLITILIIGLIIPILLFVIGTYQQRKEDTYQHNMEIMEECRGLFGKGNAANECIKTLKK